MIDLLDDVISALAYSISDRNIDTKLMHRILIFATPFDEVTKKRVEDHVEGFDEAISESDSTNAFTAMERLLGLLEGYRDIQTTTSIESLSDDLTPQFSLTPRDKETVLKLCTDMRKIVFTTDDFDQPHKKRLLNRIAAIESEVHNDKGRFDVILGGISDIGETLGKFGKDIKPLTDCMKEIRKITRRATPEYDQLPAPDDVKQITDQTEPDE